MTKKELQQSIETNQLPSDHLDDFWDNFWGILFPVVLVILFGYFTLIAIPTETSASKKSTLSLFIFSSIWLVYIVIKKLREKRLSKIRTNINPQKNIVAIENLIKSSMKLKVITSENSCYYINIPSVFNRGCTLV